MVWLVLGKGLCMLCVYFCRPVPGIRHSLVVSWVKEFNPWPGSVRSIFWEG